MAPQRNTAESLMTVDIHHQAQALDRECTRCQACVSPADW